MFDGALERNRRLAWAKFYGARSDCEQITMWAGELAEWLDQCDVDLPDAALEVIRLIRASIDLGDRQAIERYVRYHQPDVVTALTMCTDAVRTRKAHRPGPLTPGAVHRSTG